MGKKVPLSKHNSYREYMLQDNMRANMMEQENFTNPRLIKSASYPYPGFKDQEIPQENQYGFRFQGWPDDGKISCSL